VGVALLVNFIINNVTWIYCSDYLGQNYAFAFNQLSTFLLLLMQAPYVGVQVWRGQILWSEVRAVPLVPLLCMGLLDAMYDILSSMGSPYTPGDIQTLMFQLPMVFVMYGSYLLFKKRFRIGQYVGGMIILAGCCLSIGPGLVDVIKNHGGASSGTNVGSQVKAASVLITFISVLFYCANVLFKEYALKHTKVNVWFLSVAISTLNFVLTFFLVPLLWIPTMGTYVEHAKAQNHICVSGPLSARGLMSFCLCCVRSLSSPLSLSLSLCPTSSDTPSNTFPHMWAGIRCVVEGVSTMDPTAQCHSLWYLTLINAVTNVLVNVLTLQLVRSGSALLLQVVSGLNLVGCNLFYASRVIMGSTLVVAMDRFMWAGLGVVVAGFAVYSFVPLERTKIPADTDAEATATTAATSAEPVALSNTSDRTTINASNSNGSRSYSSLN
jgi:cytochrome b subunit of formate dehydrogenase